MRMRLHRLRKQITQIVFLSCALCLIPSALVFAGASITLTANPDPPTALGTQKGDTTTNFTGWTITNNSGGIEDIQIDVTSTGSWTPASTAAPNNFVLKANPTSGGAVTKVVTAQPANLRANMANGATHVLKLNFTTPTAGEEGPHTLTITLKATKWVDPCDALPCALNDGAGNCTVAVTPAGEYGLPACKRCNGTSTAPVYFTYGTKDSEGINKCNASHYACQNASCVSPTYSSGYACVAGPDNCNTPCLPGGWKSGGRITYYLNDNCTNYMGWCMCPCTGLDVRSYHANSMSMSTTTQSTCYLYP